MTMPDMPVISASQAAALGDTREGEPLPPPPVKATQPMQRVTPPSQKAVPPGGATAVHQTGGQPAFSAQEPPRGGYPLPGYDASPHHPTAGAPAGRGKPPHRRKPPRRFRLFSSGCLITAGVALLVFLGLVIIVGLVIVGQLSSRLEQGLQRLEAMSEQATFQTTTLYDRDGQELYQIFDEGRRTNVALEDLPEYVKWATISVEDGNFYQNPGIDLGSIVRSAILNVQEGTIVSGASTITQQLVRNLAFDYEYRTTTSLQRKVEEAILAVILTTRLSKDDILELYLNQIYYGNLAYGIEAASRTIFDKPAAELTLGEAALLAGLPQAPAELNPLNPDPAVQEAVLARRRLVIDLMLREGHITQDEAYAAYGEPLSYASPDVPLVAPHFTVAARDELEMVLETLGYPPDIITTGGLQVYTTLDQRIQDLAEQTVRNQVASLRDAHHLTNASVVILHPFTGEVLSMVGSVDYWDDEIDGRVNVALAQRQPGSTVKPFTYASAMEMGWTPANILWDTEVHFEQPGQPDYVPVNYDGVYHGVVRVRDALANSYNIPAVKTLQQIGVPYLLSMMRRLGVESLSSDPGQYGLSLTLGGGEVTLLELTRAYSTLANGGLLVPSTMIRCILDGGDNILYQYEGGCPKGQTVPATVNVMAYGLPVLDPRITFMISDILSDNNARTPAMGARSPLYTGNLVTSAKTGTTNDMRDNWTVGYTSNVAVGVWAGNSDNSPMINSTGLTGAAPIWHDIMLGIYNDPELLAVLAQNGQLMPDAQSPPSGLSRQHICEVGTLQDPATDCPGTRVEWVMDTPALVPDGLGNLVPGTPYLAPPLVTPNPNANGPQLNEPERGLFQAIIKVLPPEVADAVAVAAAVPGRPAFPAPRYCLVPNEVDLAQVPGAGGQLFIGGPLDPGEAAFAAQWALAHNVPILPWIPCTGEMLMLSPGAGAPVVEAYITSPAPGQQVTGDIPILGTANFTQQQAVYYKLELRGGPFPEWVTLGTTHNNAVINGQLETLGASGLPAGTYSIRLVLVGLDGNYLQRPYEVSFVKL